MNTKTHTGKNTNMNTHEHKNTNWQEYKNEHTCTKTHTGKNTNLNTYAQTLEHKHTAARTHTSIKGNHNQVDNFKLTFHVTVISDLILCKYFSTPKKIWLCFELLTSYPNSSILGAELLNYLSLYVTFKVYNMQ